MTETTRILSEHFSRERQLHGLYGLYPKYKNYINVMACFQMMMGHALCFATLQTDTGTPSNTCTALKFRTKVLNNYTFHFRV